MLSNSFLYRNLLPPYPCHSFAKYQQSINFYIFFSKPPHNIKRRRNLFEARVEEKFQEKGEEEREFKDLLSKKFYSLIVKVKFCASHKITTLLVKLLKFKVPNFKFKNIMFA
jgi:hypothetical protein